MDLLKRRWIWLSLVSATGEMARVMDARYLA